MGLHETDEDESAKPSEPARIAGRITEAAYGMGAMQEMPKDHPMRAAWEAYQATEDFNARASRHGVVVGLLHDRLERGEGRIAEERGRVATD